MGMKKKKNNVYFFSVDDVDGLDGEKRRVNTYEYFIGLRMQASNHYHFAFLYLFYAFILIGKISLTHWRNYSVHSPFQ